MREIKESGFRIRLSKDTSFLLREVDAYKRLSGLHLKEMDVGWWDTQKKKLILLELKGKGVWNEFDKDREKAHVHLVNELSKKANDVLLILGAVWAGTELGLEIKKDLPIQTHKYPKKGNIKLIFLIDTPGSRMALLPPVKDRLNQILAGRTRLFGIRYVTLVDFDTAQRMGLPVQRP